jgi:hypothetical protein
MKSPKEKADELVDVYYQLVDYPTPHWKNLSKQCALIAIEEVLKYSKAHGFIGLTDEYLEIKKEIEKL